jgi:RNA polymerase sigma factor (sigma-70 family)
VVTAAAVPDAAVIQESWRDAEHFAVLYDRYAAQLYRFAYRRVGPEAAEDVVADAFLAAFRARRRYDMARPDARPWLFGILTKEIARRRRSEEARYRALARAASEATVDGDADRVLAGVSARAARASLAAALSRLSSGDRDVLLLVAWGDLTYDEVAQALGIPVGTVRSRLNRARRKTQEALGGTDPTELIEERG